MRSSSVIACLTLAAVSAVVVTPLTLTAQRARAATPITAAEVDAHLRFLSSDLLEGRAPATRGGQLAAEYIASELREYGLTPGVNGSWFQDVPIDVVTAQPQTIHVATGGKAPATLRFPEDVVMWAGSAVDSSAMRGEIVFVGYGVNAPENKWNDFKGMDLKGKILLILVNDPPAPANEPALFGGKAMTYYGRWTYKFEEAERQGAAGALIIHTTERAGYPWHTVVGSWAKEQRMLPRDASLPAPLGVRGWITDSAATSLLSRAGLDLAALRTQAASRDFQPVPTGITIDASFRNTVAHMQSQNVVGVVPGSDAKAKNEYVVFSAHWDHLGIGPAVNGDSIYNGASDNASGVADLLAVARAAAEGPKPKRSMLFVFVTAEESGLLGSEWFGQHPTVPRSQIVADINLDGGNVLGRTRDLTVLGDTKSSLGPELAAMIKPIGMRISPDEHPERGAFYRSDHFSFAKVGIPSVSIGAGNDFVDHPQGWGSQQDDYYTEHNYHQPSDEYDPKFDLSGATQLSQIVLRLGLKLANDPGWPTWSKGAEFKR
jgi:Zn-dependent M28 family amino/carboxypeptidase